MSADLLALTADLVAIPSVSHAENALADRLEAELSAIGGLAVTRVGDNVVARTERGRRHRLVLAGHLDTVPPVGNETPRFEGDTLWGVGSADMKGGLAVMLDLARNASDPAVDLTFCFYACEEVGRAHSGLAEIWAVDPELLVADAAILGEPTGALVEAGCQGTIRVTVHLAGVRADTARPFTGRNAIHRLAPILEKVASWPGRTVDLDGCAYAEQLQAVAVTGGVAGNVVPDSADLTVNYRFAPDRDLVGAMSALGDLWDGTVDESLGDHVDVLDAADGAPPGLGHELLAALVAATGAPPRAKVGWTDVASFAAHGVPAANFGPGDPLLAHHPDERVERASLERARAVLGSLVGAGP